RPDATRSDPGCTRRGWSRGARRRTARASSPLVARVTGPLQRVGGWLKLHHMRVQARALVVVALLACAGCRRGPEAPVDPTHSGLRECPAGEPHLVIGLQALRSDAVQAIARYTLDLATCRGAALPSGELGTISAVGALA